MNLTVCVNSQECVCAGRTVLRILTKLRATTGHQVRGESFPVSFDQSKSLHLDSWPQAYLVLVYSMFSPGTPASSHRPKACMLG